MIALFLLTAVLFPIVGYLYISWKYSYWNRKGIYQLEPKFPYGNFSEQANGTMGIADNFTKIYREIKSNGHKHGGIYQLIKPIYVPTDLDIIRHILQKDFNHFVNHGGFVNEKNDPLSAHLFGLEDDKWKNLRAKLTPTFTTGKMKMMFPTMVACTEGLGKVLKESAKLQDAVDIKDVVARFTTDIIGSAGFGLDVNSLNDPDSVFRKFGKKLFNDGFWKRIKRMLAQSVPKTLLSLIKFKLTDPEVEEFFMGVVENIIEYREKNNIYRKDFMHLMLQLKNKGKITDDEDIKESFDGDGHLSVTQVAAQCFVFFVGGFETSSTTMTLALLELAQNKDVQNKLREEIKTVLKKHDNQITYEAIMEMPYLDKVVYETLRKHSPAPGTPRVCNKTYKVPNTDLVLDVGTRVIIPVFGIHRDPEYYPEPEKFDPERFNEENKAKRHPCAFLPFGEGPRMCIGARFGMLQTKVGLAAIIRDFDVTLSSKTKLPITYSIKSPITSIYGDVWLNLKTIE